MPKRVAPMIEVRTCSVRELLVDVAAAGLVAPLVHADPPWSYSRAAPPKHGRQDGHYGGLSCIDIAEDLDTSAIVATRDAYLDVWCTWPMLFEFTAAWLSRQRSWQQLTGGSWGKIGRRGIGFHMLGDSEPLLVFARGKPRPLPGPVSNRWTTWPAPSDAPYWEESRGGHSEKPATALTDLVRMATRPGDLVLDLYAGESASLARVCALEGRSYLGAEIDPKRAERARGQLAAIRDAIG